MVSTTDRGVLQALSEQANSLLSLSPPADTAQSRADDVLSQAIVEAMRSGIGMFDEEGFSFSRSNEK